MSSSSEVIPFLISQKKNDLPLRFIKRPPHRHGVWLLVFLLVDIFANDFFCIIKHIKYFP
jgi:hypothetical protein